MEGLRVTVDDVLISIDSMVVCGWVKGISRYMCLPIGAMGVLA